MSGLTQIHVSLLSFFNFSFINYYIIQSYELFTPNKKIELTTAKQKLETICFRRTGSEAVLDLFCVYD